MADIKESYYLIGVGASSGGLESLKRFIAQIPENRKDFVMIIAQHLSPTYKSTLVSLLGKASHYPVREAHHGMVLELGNIYISPADTDISVENERIVLSKPNNQNSPKPSIDLLFESIAKEYKEEAVGIILSGTGKDGSKGIIAIREFGGTTIAEDPKSAKFDGMPVSAIETGFIKYIFVPDMIGLKLFELLPVKSSNVWVQNKSNIGNDLLLEILKNLTKIKGTDFSNYKQSTIVRRIEKRIDALNLEDIKEYKKFLDDHTEEYQSLFDTFLIGVTSFYRDEEAFVSLEKQISNIIKSKSKGDSIRIWAPGCSTGEEAYSIATLLVNLLGEKISDFTVQIFATDIDDRSISIARRGIYPNSSIHFFKSIDNNDYFIQNNDTFEISKFIRGFLLFTNHDLTTHPPFMKLDLVVCRNLLIYFSNDLQQKIIPRFHYALNPNGILFLGKSESIGNFSNLFTTIDSKNKIYIRKSGGVKRSLRLTGNTPLIYLPKQKFSNFDNNTLPPIKERVKDTLFNEYDYPYVIINETFSVEQIIGDVSPFLGLPEGEMNTNIIKMSRPEFQIILRYTIINAFREKSNQLSDSIRFPLNNSLYNLFIKVKPILNSDLYLVIFEYYLERALVTPNAMVNSDTDYNEKIITLEKELEETKKHLKIYIKELESSNEELQNLNEEVQSTNEELQSSNEELETSLEELLSTNEEIQIAYTELKIANDELELKDNLLKTREASQTALLKNSLQSFILTANNFNIISFNQKADATFTQHFKTKLNIGENFLQLINKNLFPNLENDLIKLNQGEMSFGEIVLNENTIDAIYFAYNFTPVLDISKQLSIVSISLLDITFTKVIESNLRKTENLLKSIFNAVPVGISITDQNGIFTNVNQSFCEIYKIPKSELIGKHFTIIIPKKEWAYYEIIFKKFIIDGESQPTETTATRAIGETFDAYTNSELLVDSDGSRYKVTSVLDISDRKHASESMRIANERYSYLTKATNDAIWDWDMIQNTLFWGEGFQNIFGYDTKNQKLNFEQWRNNVHIDDHERVLESLNDHIYSGKESLLELQYRYKKKNGDYASVIDRSFLIRGENGIPIRMVGAMQDITKSKAEEHRLNLLESVITNSSDGVIITEAEPIDHPGPKIVYVNDALLKITGYDREELIGKTPRILQGPETNQKELAKLKLAMTKWEPCEIQVINYKKNGETFWNEFSIFPLANETGWFTHWIAIEKDVTKRKLQIDEKEKLIHELTQNNKDLRQFTYITSHNLRAPLSNLVGALNIIEDFTIEDPLLLELLNGLRISTNLLNQTVNDLIKILIIKDSPATEQVEVSFESILLEVTTQIQNLIASANCELEVNFEAAPNIIFSRAYLESILMNLLTNSLKYRSSNRKLIINIKSYKEDNITKLIFEDNGLGIDLIRNKNKIFGLYQRFHNFPDSKGLGLYLVKSQVESLGGSIEVQSSVDVGTKFVICFRN